MDLEDFRYWLAVEQDLADSTVSTYLGQVRKFATWFQQTNGEALAAANLTNIDVREYRAHLLAGGETAPASINLALGAIRAYGRWQMARGRLKHNPVKGVREVRLPPAPIRWLDKPSQSRLLRELEKDLAAARTEPARRAAVLRHSLVVFLLNTGLRVGEVCKLYDSDVKVGERSGTVEVRYAKANTTRTVQLNVPARKAITDWRAVRPATDRRQLFLSQRGTPLQRRNVQKMLEAFSQRIGAKVTPHTLRHTFAKNLVNAGIEIEQVALLMGHASIATTAVYVVPSWAELVKAVELLEN